MHKAWIEKKELSKLITNQKIDDLYNFGLKNGALGGKLLGAGGGGFLMFYSNKPNQLIEAFKDKLTRLKVYDLEGHPSKVALYRNDTVNTQENFFKRQISLISPGSWEV